ncbi:DNA topology modulation protein [Bacillus sp. SG-1]|uniref:DNA topology modulation protein n=1 Tax=Bacillus sp. SG-1 TaxID=161544 RepID=UPI0003137C96|nr:DNA topology modulation protein [Bacillus sp. SG-1]
MKKVAIIGSGGSGKSTLARRLGLALDTNVWHLDQLLWKPNWTPVKREEQTEIQEALVKNDKWIIDGNYNSTLNIRLEAADTIIFLDISRYVCVYRVFKRMIKFRNKTRPDMKEGCHEKLNLKFLKWIWDYPKTKKPIVLAKLENLSTEKEIIILRSSEEVEEFINFVECKTKA